VHPCELLVTGSEGAILSRALLGDTLSVSPGQIGTEKDCNRVFYFDLPIQLKRGADWQPRSGASTTNHFLLDQLIATGMLQRSEPD